MKQFEAILSDLNFQSQTTKHDKWLEASASLLKLKKVSTTAIFILDKNCVLFTKVSRTGNTLVEYRFDHI